MTIKDIYEYCLFELDKSDEKYIETELLIAHVLKKDRVYVKINLQENITKEEEMLIKKHISELKDEKPIHYILGVRDFYGYDFDVCTGVLIPRSDTEILVEKSIKVLSDKFNKDIKGLEIGVGTGIISISLLKNLPNLTMKAVDINEKAIDISNKNAMKLGVSDRIEIIKSDLYKNIGDEKFDFIISNPPYISEADMEKLSRKVRGYEPETALYAKDNGLYFYDKIIEEAKKYLKSDFCIFFEIGYDQGQSLKNIFDKYGYSGKCSVIKDYSKNDRVVTYVQ